MAKSIVLIVIIVTIFAVDVNGQVPPNPLFHSQDAINYYHELYDEMKMTIQGYMAGYIRDITDEVLEILTSTMDTWRRQHRALPSGEMFRKLVNLRSSTEIGEMIRQCTSDVFWRVSEHQEYAFYDLEEWQEYSTGLLISVVLKLGDYDIVGRYEEFIDEFNPVIQEAHDRFQFEFVPNFEIRLRDLRDSQEEVTQDYRQCISSVFKLH